MKLKPINNRVLVRRAKSEKVSKGGIIIPDTVDHKAHKGEVLAVSEGKRLKDGSFYPHDFKPGDVIVFEKWADTDLGKLEPDLLMVEGDDVLGVEVP